LTPVELQRFLHIPSAVTVTVRDLVQGLLIGSQILGLGNLTDTITEQANAFAHAAEEYAERGQFAQAVEAHFRAAEQFLLATSYTSDPEAVRTLKLLYSNHTRQGKDLQRRLQQHSTARANAAAAVAAATATSPPTTRTPTFPPSAATSPQATPVLRSRPVSATSQPPRRLDTGAAAVIPVRGDTPDSTLLGTVASPTASAADFGYGSRNYFVGQQLTPDDSLIGLPPPRRDAVPATVNVVSLDTTPAASTRTPRPLHDSIDTSYYMLGGSGSGSHEVPREDEPEDPFNRFWDAVENLVQKISIPAPLAFTTAPIAKTDAVQPPPPQQGRRSPPAFGGRYVYGYGVEPANLSETLRTNTILGSYLVVGDGGSQIEAPGVPKPLAGGQPGMGSTHMEGLGSVDSNFFGRAAPPAPVEKPGKTQRGATRSPAVREGVVEAAEARAAAGSTKTREELLIENEQL
ncbi:hypothetical protein HDU96_003445, partial [Phlyctochytrium bullatum]